jgi:spermidine synthase
LRVDQEARVRDRRTAIVAIFILSGASGLIYEVVWSRQLVLVFGNTTQAIAAILTGYFGGMAVGSLVGGRVADRVRSPLRLYGALELVLVGVVLATPLLFSLIRTVYGSAYSSLVDQPALLAGIRFVLAVLALAPATVLMGATLPSLSRHLARRAADLGDVFGRLYAANTLGAIVGAAAAGFVLIEVLGLSDSLRVGAAGSAFAGVTALFLARRPDAAPMDRVGSDEFRSAVATTTDPLGEPARHDTSATGSDRVDLRRVAVVMSFVSGLTSLGYQTLWTRLLSSGTGGSSYVFSAILVCFLIGLAIGPLIVGIAARRGIDTLDWLARSQVLVGVLATVGTLFIAFRPLHVPDGIAWMIVVLPTATAIGLSLPLVSRLIASGDHRVGSDTGLLLATNTLGIVIGTVGIPFIAMTTIGSPLTVLVLALANIGAAWWIWRLRPTRRRRMEVFSAPIVAAAVLAIAFAGLARDPSVVTIKRAGHMFATGEDEIASVQAGTIGRRSQLWVAGTSMTAMTVDARLMSVLPAMARPDARSLLVIAFGMGSSYRTGLILGDRVDGVELVPTVPRMFKYFYPDADAVLADPRGHLVISDGRNYVELTDRRYDTIVVDPPPPIESAGTGVLYSREFYAAAARRLNAGGVMMEWIPFGQRLDEFMAHARTFADVFPEVTLAFGPGGYGVFMLGSDRPVTLLPEAIRSVLERPGVTDNLSTAPDSPAHDSAAWSRLIPSLVFATGDVVRSGVGPGPTITDDHPRTEYFLVRRIADLAGPPMSHATLLAAFTRP